MKRYPQIAGTLIVVLLVTGLFGCGPTPMGEASDARDRAKAKIDEYNIVVGDIMSLRDEAFATEDTPEGYQQAFDLLDQAAAKSEESVSLLGEAKAEMMTILALNVSETYKNYVQQEIAIVDAYVALQGTDGEATRTIRSYFEELAKKIPDKAVLAELSTKIDELSASMDAQTAVIDELAAAADAYYQDNGLGAK